LDKKAFQNMKILYSLFLTIFFLGNLVAQEFMVDVKVQAPSVQTNDRQIFSDLETALRNFINQQAWTQISYEETEKIRGSMVFTITNYDPSSANMSGNLQLQFARPVYMSDYQSPTLLIQDADLTFNYRSNTVLEFNIGRYSSNLTSIVSFYCYVALGLDASSFSPKQNSYFSQAQVIAANAASAGAGGGWDRFKNNLNRHWIIEDIINPANSDFISIWYDYHRLGVDKLFDPAQQIAAKELMRSTIQRLKLIHDKQPNSFLLQWFFDTKSNEIRQVYSGGPNYQSEELIKDLQAMDPSNSNNYLNMGR
jgi:hypothetical protein|tara:strand:+ start:3400 stop:4326 length:927 start_codon:yes stop_codon:yes gene_type:complete